MYRDQWRFCGDAGMSDERDLVFAARDAPVSDVGICSFTWISSDTPSSGTGVCSSWLCSASTTPSSPLRARSSSSFCRCRYRSARYTHDCPARLYLVHAEHAGFCPSHRTRRCLPAEVPGGGAESQSRRSVGSLRLVGRRTG